jgi:outer membrane protein assembly factor BamB/orotate phosphoribosyltransferase
VEILLEYPDRLRRNATPGLIPALEALRERIVSRFGRKLVVTHLGLARDRYREFIGNQEAIGHQLERRLVVPSWGEADYQSCTSPRSVAGSASPKFRLKMPLSLGHEFGVSLHAHLYPEHGRRDAVAELCALFNLLISIFDWVNDCSPDAHHELASVFSEETVRRLCADSSGAHDLQQALATVQHPGVRALIKTMITFFTNLHAWARTSVNDAAWERLSGLLVRAYRAEIVTTGLNGAAHHSFSEALAAAQAKSVLPFEIFLAIAIACEDQPLALHMDDALALVRSFGTLISIADDVADLVSDYRSGDANTILLNLGISSRNAAAHPPDDEFAFDGEKCAEALVEGLYENVTLALSLAASGRDSSRVQRFGDVIVGYAQGWLGLTELDPHVDGADTESAAFKRALLTDAVKLAQGIRRRDGNPCGWLIDGRSALLRSNTLQIATRRLWEKLRPYRPTAVGGVSLGADPLVAGLMIQAQGEGWPLKGFMIRQAPKKHGLCKQVEGPELTAQDRVALVDDLIGGGGTLQLATRCIEPFGAQIVAAGALIDLHKGGAADLRRRGVPVETLFTGGELGMAIQSPLRPGAWKLQWSVPGIYRGQYWAPKSSPTSAGGHIYLGSDTGYVACLAVTGEEQWRHAVRDTVRGVHGRPLILDGKVYFGAYDGFAYCLDAQSGSLLWETHCAGSIVTSVAACRAGGAVCVAGATDKQAGVLVTLSAETGHILWRLESQSPLECTPGFDAQRGRLIAGANNGVVVAVDASSGEVAWQFATGGAVKGAVAIDRHGRCYFGSEDGFVYAVDGSAGALLWKRKISHSLHTEPLLCGDMLVAAGNSKRVVALKTDTGEVCWITTLRAPHVGGVALVADKWIALGCDAGTVYLLDREQGLPVWTYHTGGSIRSTPAVIDNRLLVPSTDGKLYCFAKDAHE